MTDCQTADSGAGECPWPAYVRRCWPKDYQRDQCSWDIRRSDWHVFRGVVVEPVQPRCHDLIWEDGDGVLFYENCEEGESCPKS